MHFKSPAFVSLLTSIIMNVQSLSSNSASGLFSYKQKIKR